MLLLATMETGVHGNSIVRLERERPLHFLELKPKYVVTRFSPFSLVQREKTVVYVLVLAQVCIEDFEEERINQLGRLVLTKNSPFQVHKDRPENLAVPLLRKILPNAVTHGPA